MKNNFMNLFTLNNKEQIEAIRADTNSFKCLELNQEDLEKFLQSFDTSALESLAKQLGYEE